MWEDKDKTRIYIEKSTLEELRSTLNKYGPRDRRLKSYRVFGFYLDVAMVEEAFAEKEIERILLGDGRGQV